MVEATNAEALAKFKIPKTSKKALGAALADGQDKAESESNFKRLYIWLLRYINLIPPSRSPANKYYLFSFSDGISR